jgi:hypothetical protein
LPGQQNFSSHASVRRKTRSRCFLRLIGCNRKSGWQLSDKTWFGIPPIRSWNRPVKKFENGMVEKNDIHRRIGKKGFPTGRSESTVTSKWPRTW